MKKNSRNSPFDGKTCVRFDSEYKYNKVTFEIINGTDLLVTFTNSRKPKQYRRVFTVETFTQYTALEVIRRIGQGGRHFEDGIHEIWSNLCLSFGYNQWL